MENRLVIAFHPAPYLNSSKLTYAITTGRARFKQSDQANTWKQ